MSGSMTALSGGFSFTGPVRPAIGARFKAVAGFLAAQWRLRRDLAQLQSMDARGLQDIGLTRGSLEGAVRHGRRAPALARNVPQTISEMPEWPAMPSSWTEWR